MQVISRPHPFTENAATVYVEHGKTVQEIVDELQPKKPIQECLHVYLDGMVLPRAYWSNVRPKETTEILVNAYPSGGDSGKDGRRTALMVVVQVATAIATGGMGNTAQALWMMAATYASVYVADQLWPLPGPEDDPDELKDIRSGRNQQDRYGAVPTVFGEHKIFPNFIAPPFNDIQGDDQFINLLYSPGHSPIHVDRESCKIGDTLISSLSDDDVEMEIYDGFENRDDNTIYPFATQPNTVNLPLERFTFEESHFFTVAEHFDSIISDDVFLRTKSLGGDDRSVEVAGISSSEQRRNLGNAWSSWSYDVVPEYFETINQVYTSPEGVGFVDFNLAFPEGLHARRGPGQSRRVQSARIVVLRREVGTTEWELAREVDIRDTTRTPFRHKIKARLPQNAAQDRTYEVAISSAPRINYAAIDSNAVADTVILTDVNFFFVNLRSPYRGGGLDFQEPVTEDGLAWIALRVKAAEISGNVNRFSCNTHTVVPQLNTVIDWKYEEGETIEEYVDRVGAAAGSIQTPATDAWKTTKNPAELYRWGLQGPWAREPISKDMIDIESLFRDSDNYRQYCVDKGFSCNLVVNNFQPLSQVIRNVLATSRATFTITRDGRYSVAWDKQHDSPVQMFTPKNSWDFESSKVFLRVPHALKIQFFDEDKDYAESEFVVYNDGFDHTNATRFEELSVPGVTNKDQVYRLGRYNLASMVLRPEEHKLSTDSEYLVAKRGDLVSLSHDVILVGQTHGRIKSVGDGTSTFNITIDEQISLDSEEDYGFSLRTNNGDKSVLLLDSPSSGVFDPGEQLTVTLSEGSKPESGDLYAFGISGRETSDMILASVETGEDYSAELTLIDYAPEIFDTDQEPIPPFDPNITEPDEFKVPQTPEIEVIDTGIDLVQVDDSGELVARVLVVLKERDDNNVPINRIEAQIRNVEKAEGEDGNEVELVRSSWKSDDVNVYGNKVFFNDLQSGQTVDVRVRYVSEFNQKSPWKLLEDVEVIGALVKPPPVVNATFDQRKNGMFLTWDEPQFPIIDNYVITDSPDVDDEEGFIPRENMIAVVQNPQYDLGLITEDKNYYVFTRSLIGLVSDPVEISVVVNAPSIPQDFVSEQTTEGVVLSWDDSVFGYGIEHYEIRSDLESGPVVTRTTSTSHNLGLVTQTRTYHIHAVDIAGQSSGFSNHEVSPQGPGEITNFFAEQKRDGVEVTWDTPTTIYPLKHYELREDDEFGEEIGLITRTTSEKVVLERISQLTEFNIIAVDIAGLESPFVQFEFLPEGPGQPGQVQATQTTNGFRLIWDESTSIYPIDFYEVRENTNWGSNNGLIDKVKGTSVDLSIRKEDFTIYIRAEGIEGLVSPHTESLITIEGPGQVQNFNTRVLDNTVILSWSPAISIFPIDFYEVRRGSDFETADIIGNFGSTFSVVEEDQAGDFTYWVRAVDSAGNFGPEVSSRQSVDNPPDFTLRRDDTVDLTQLDSSENVKVIDADSGFALVDTEETWEEHFQRAESNLGHTGDPITFQEMINGGYDFYLQPSLLSGHLEKIIDLEATIPGTRLQVTLNRLDLEPGVEANPTIGFSEDGIDFDEFNAWEAFGRDFQFIKIRVDFTAPDDKALLKIQELGFVLNVKQRTDQGEAVIAEGTKGDGGTEIPFNIQFLDVEAINVTVKLASDEDEDDFIPVVIFDDEPNPESFNVVVFDANGNRVQKKISWIARGV